MTEDEDLGRAVVHDGRLIELRKRLGISRNAMAEYLYVSTYGYRMWELKPTTRLNSQTAGRVGRFYKAATSQLDIIEAAGTPIGDMVPLHQLAVTLAVTQESLLERYRNGELPQVRELGLLGLWVDRRQAGTLR